MPWAVVQITLVPATDGRPIERLYELAAPSWAVMLEQLEETLDFGSPRNP
jgi:hypothetical protein